MPSIHRGSLKISVDSSASSNTKVSSPSVFAFPFLESFKIITGTIDCGLISIFVMGGKSSLKTFFENEILTKMTKIKNIDNFFCIISSFKNLNQLQGARAFSKWSKFSQILIFFDIFRKKHIDTFCGECFYGAGF